MSWLGVPMAAGTKAPCLRTALCFELPVFAAQGVGALFRVSLIAQEFVFSLPCRLYHLISVSSCQELAGNQGTQFPTTSSHDARRSVSSGAWVSWPNPAHLCQKLGSSELESLGYPSIAACQPALCLL